MSALLMAGMAGAPAALGSGAASASAAAQTTARGAQTGRVQTGAAQTGAAQTGAAQTGAAQTEAAQTEAAQTEAVQTGAAQIGPAQINALGRPGLCWEASGNGAPITLEDCDSAIQNEQWTLTANGVLMNGIGYCLEAGTGAVNGGEPLIVDFAGQCGGSSGQLWQFSGTTGQFTSPGTGVCAVLGGRLEPGTQIVRGACSAAPPVQRWSLGYSALTLSAGTGTGTGPFTASVTAANAASAQTAYRASIRLGAPRGLTVTALRGTGGATGWTCNVRALTCTGSLAAGAAGRIDIAGRMPAGARRGGAYVLTAAASVTGTSPQPGTALPRASVRVTVLAAPPGGQATAGAAGAGRPGGPALGGVPLVAIIAGILLLGGVLLLALGRRRPTVDPGHRPPGRHGQHAHAHAHAQHGHGHGHGHGKRGHGQHDHDQGGQPGQHGQPDEPAPPGQPGPPPTAPPRQPDQLTARFPRL